ncbi:trypco2 family protein [Nocardiopsis halotolerans]|uniref:trypco2 family protein n=1 Tax=Nocardiopsis halotolerans TaxID=124252 RepID=UPI0003455680|nr:trypco2 family protein [Nocardiopsis halotolerans]
MDLRLTDAVQTLRDELTEAVKEAETENPDITFDVGPVQMEFEVQFRFDGKAKSKVAAWIVSGEAEAGMSRIRTHRVSFTLTPRNSNHPQEKVSVSSGQQHDAGPGDRSGRINP